MDKLNNKQIQDTQLTTGSKPSGSCLDTQDFKHSFNSEAAALSKNSQIVAGHARISEEQNSIQGASATQEAINEVSKPMTNNGLVIEKNPNIIQLDVKERKEEVFENIGRTFGFVTNVATTVLHGASMFTQTFSVTPEKITKKINDLTVGFSRWVLPINYLIAASKAFSAKRGIEGLIKLFVPALKSFLPFFNFNFVDGLHSSVNFFHDYILKGIRKTNPTLQFSNFKDNARQSWAVFKGMFDELKSGKIGMAQMNFVLCTGMFFGSLAGLVLSPFSRNNTTAKIAALVRNACGGVADMIVLLQKPESWKIPGEFLKSWKEFVAACKDPQEQPFKVFGVTCFISSVVSLVQRLLTKDEAKANVMIHFQDFLNTIGFTYWNYAAEDRTNEAELAKKKQAEQALALGEFSVSKDNNVVLPSLDKLREQRQQAQLAAVQSGIQRKAA